MTASCRLNALCAKKSRVNRMGNPDPRSAQLSPGESGKIPMRRCRRS